MFLLCLHCREQEENVKVAPVTTENATSDSHSSFQQYVDSSKRVDEALLAKYQKEVEVDHFFKSCSERVIKLDDFNTAWVRFKVSEILYQAEMYQFQTSNMGTNYYQNAYQPQYNYTPQMENPVGTPSSQG